LLCTTNLSEKNSYRHTRSPRSELASSCSPLPNPIPISIHSPSFGRYAPVPHTSPPNTQARSWRANDSLTDRTLIQGWVCIGSEKSIAYLLSTIGTTHLSQQKTPSSALHKIQLPANSIAHPFYNVEADGVQCVVLWRNEHVMLIQCDTPDKRVAHGVVKIRASSRPKPNLNISFSLCINQIYFQRPYTLDVSYTPRGTQ
jgi:hypothetical protein